VLRTFLCSARFSACGHRQASKEHDNTGMKDGVKNTGLWATTPEQWRGKDCVSLFFAMLAFRVLCRVLL